MRILVVDDDYVSRLKLKSLLATYGDCDSAPGGMLAMELFQAAHNENLPYNLITVDLEMPDMNGNEYVTYLRDWERQHSKLEQEVKILVITVKNDPGDVIKSFRAGCEWYLTKPVNQENLHAALQKIGLVK